MPPHLKTFKVETKRSFLTIRQSIRDKGKLWVPTTLVIEEDRLRLASLDGSREIRPRRLAWQEPNKFLIAGVDERTRVQRILLRFKTAEEASGFADLLKESLSVIIEPLPQPAEEIQVELQFLSSLPAVIPATIRVLLALILLAGLAAYISNGSIAGVAASIAVIFLSYILVLGLVNLALMKRVGRLKGWLKFEQASVILTTGASWNPIFPKAISWENSTSIILRSRGLKMKILFLSSEDAVRAVRMLRERFPKLEVTNIGYC